MPGFLTEHVNNRVLDCFFGGSSIEAPPTLFVGLSLARSYRGGYVSEPAGGGYARAAVPNDRGQFGAASGGAKFNARSISFPSPTSAWGLVLSVFVADSPEGGRVLAMADLPAPRPIHGGDPAPTIAAHALFLSHH